MTLEEKIGRMTLAELRAALLKVKASEKKGTPIRALPSNSSVRARLTAGRSRLDYSLERLAPELKVNVAYAKPMSQEEVHPQAHLCDHELHRARWIPGPFQVAQSSTWMVPCVCAHCGEMVRKFVEVKG